MITKLKSNLNKYGLYLLAFLSGILLTIITSVLIGLFRINEPAVIGDNLRGEMKCMEKYSHKNNKVNHSGHYMGNTEDMPMMNDMLKIYTDKDFLELMIIHHQDALDMANNALSNSKNEFIRNLSQEIIKTQSREIISMKEELKNVGN